MQVYYRIEGSRLLLATNREVTKTPRSLCRATSTSKRVRPVIDTVVAGTAQLATVPDAGSRETVHAAFDRLLTGADSDVASAGV